MTAEGVYASVRKGSPEYSALLSAMVLLVAEGRGAAAIAARLAVPRYKVYLYAKALGVRLRKERQRQPRWGTERERLLSMIKELGAVTVKELVSATGKTRQTVYGELCRMEAKGLVRRDQSRSPRWSIA